MNKNKKLLVSIAILGIAIVGQPASASKSKADSTVLINPISHVSPSCSTDLGDIGHVDVEIIIKGDFYHGPP